MKTILTLMVVLIVVPSVYCAPSKISSCPPIGGRYSCSPYLEMATELQSVGEEKAVARIKLWARSGKYEEQVIILCRMLFMARKSTVFRRPMIGGAFFVGGTGYKDWPLEPIALHKGVPILIAPGYILCGHAEESADYLEYCLKTCTWSDTKYKVMEPVDIKAVIQDFIDSREWSSDPSVGLLKQAEQGAAGNPLPAE